MSKFKIILPAIAFWAFWMMGAANAQTISLGEAVAEWAGACGADVERSCSKMNHGSSGFQSCIQQNGSQACQAATSAFNANLQARYAAQAEAPQICRTDVQRFCSNFNPGQARVLRCLMRPENLRAASPMCRNTLEAAGWLDTISIRSNSRVAQVADSIETLGRTAQKVGVNTEAIRRDIEARIQAEGDVDAPAGATELDVLKQLPNFIVQVDFFLDSDVVKPGSWVTVGRMADALRHPLLAGNRFLIVGHTDITGSRSHNLGLSDRRAKAFEQILESVFQIPADRLLAVGVGEELLLPDIPKDDPRNRRVELINIGPI
ncbi:MAG: OmpA family protein [Rhizobiaceae bacterium]